MLRYQRECSGPVYESEFFFSLCVSLVKIMLRELTDNLVADTAYIMGNSATGHANLR